MELATALIWILRIVLPIILFCIYFKLQAPKDDEQDVSGGPQYSVRQLVQLRRAMKSEPPPKPMADLVLKDATEAPALFAHNRTMRQQTSRRDSRESREARDAREGREGRDGREAREARRERKDRESNDRSSMQARALSRKTDLADATLSIEAPPEDPEKDRHHVTSLVNYVAFPRQHRQRMFLLAEGQSPPLPPLKVKQKTLAESFAKSVLATQASNTAGPTSSAGPTDNAEAQRVLRGAICLRTSDPVRNVFTQLTDSQVEISERTFTLMIEACILAQDLKSASDFLMKMESAGHSPHSDLLDKVMDLYALQKTEREQQQRQAAQRVEATAMINAAEAEKPLDGLDLLFGKAALSQEDAVRKKLSSSAAAFVPHFGPGIPPPPPLPPVVNNIDGPTGEAAAEGAESPVGARSSAAASPSKDADAILVPPVEPPTRTKLVASAKPFEPQLNMNLSLGGFEPMMYPWGAIDPRFAQAGEYGEYGSKQEGDKETKKKSNQGKGASKGKAKTIGLQTRSSIDNS